MTSVKCALPGPWKEACLGEGLGGMWVKRSGFVSSLARRRFLNKQPAVLCGFKICLMHLRLKLFPSAALAAGHDITCNQRLC